MILSTPLPQNDSLLNRAARRRLKGAKTQTDQQAGAMAARPTGRAEWPADDTYVLQRQMGHLLGWSPADVMEWLVINPNGPDDPDEQEQSLTLVVQWASTPVAAAAHLLSAIYSRTVAVLPALQPAASELR